MNFAKFFRTLNYIKHLRWLLLKGCEYLWTSENYVKIVLAKLSDTDIPYDTDLHSKFCE